MLSYFYRAINKHQMFTYHTFLFYYILQFVLVAIFIKNGDGSDCIWKAACIMLVSFDVVMILQMFRLNLNEQHQEIVKTID